MRDEKITENKSNSYSNGECEFDKGKNVQEGNERDEFETGAGELRVAAIETHHELESER